MSFQIFLYRFSRLMSLLSVLLTLKVVQIIISQNSFSYFYFALIPFSFVIILNWICFGEFTVWIDSKYGKK